MKQNAKHLRMSGLFLRYKRSDKTCHILTLESRKICKNITISYFFQLHFSTPYIFAYMQKGNLIVAFSKNINLNWKTEIVDWCVKCWIVSFRVTTNIVIYVQYSCQILLTSFSVYKYCLYAHWHKLPIIKFLFYW